MAQEKVMIPTPEAAGETISNITAPIDSVGSNGMDSIAGAVHDMSLWGLFLQADLVVKLVMLLLIAASIACWAIIFQKFSLISATRKKLNDFLDLFWNGREGKDMQVFYNECKNQQSNPLSRIFVAGMFECYEKKGRRAPTKRAERALNSAATRELSVLERHVSFLATVGSAGPFIGLFGTVWGIMRSFTSIAMTNNTSLAVVAPGIAEALFATAIGLFAAIPAVIFYNKFNGEISKIATEVDDFVDELLIFIDREFDQ